MHNASDTVQRLQGAKLSPVYDIAIIGSGFAGSLTAMIARRLGFSVVLIERGRHPRFMIGESSTPLSNLLLEELANRYDLSSVKPLTKWGSWQKQHPEIGCGLKRGFTFYHHELGRADAPDPKHQNQLLVAGSPNDRIADTHWYRADFDFFLLQQAQQMGADYLGETMIEGLSLSAGGADITGRSKGGSIQVRARFLLDATGPRGFLHHALRLDEDPLPHYPATQALYSHFNGVKRLDELAAFDPAPPYPVDDAAVHHVFDGGWVWVLRFNNGRVSAGVAATDDVAQRLSLVEGGVAWRRLLTDLPTLERQFADATAVEPFRHIPRLSFLGSQIQGDRWALLPSAAGFVDPLLSTGFPLTLLGISRLATILECHWSLPERDEWLRRYASETRSELLATAHLIAALYANMNRFRVFAALSLLYFAAASFSETVRRLKRPQLAPSFLLHDHPAFGSECKGILQRSLSIETEQDEDHLIADVVRAIEPLDMAGLCRPDRHNWYPVDADDLLGAASKAGGTGEEIEAMLMNCGFYA